MAPDLTHEYSKLGPEGMHYALRTLYFPAMNALFLKRQLTDQEERDLSAFFQNADSSRRLNSHTAIFRTQTCLCVPVTEVCFTAMVQSLPVLHRSR